MESIIKKNIRKNPQELGYQVDLGNLYIQQGSISQGKDEYNKAIKSLKPDGRQITQLANAFLNYEQLELAAKTYEEGRKLLQDDNIFLLDLASLYEKLGNPKNAISYYLTYLDYNPSDGQTVRSSLQAVIQKKDCLKGSLLKKRIYI